MSEPSSPGEADAPAPGKASARGRSAPLLVAALAVLAFLPALTFGFVYVDRSSVVKNPWLDESLRGLMGSLASGTAHATGIPDATRPSVVASFWLDRRLFGLAAPGYHTHSLLLYAAVCAGAWFAAASLLKDRRGALFAAALFAVAPLHAEVVSTVTYRDDLIAALGTLLPIGFLFRDGAGEDSLEAGLGMALVYGWGLLAKESAAVLLALVPLLAAVLRAGRAWLRARERTLFLLLSTFVLWVNWRLALLAGGDDIARAPQVAISTRFLDTARFFVRSVASSFGLARPSPEFPAAGHAGPAWAVAAAVIAAVSVALALSPRTRPYAAGLTVAGVAPLAASPLVGPATPWADRYVFVGVLGGALCVGAALSELSRRVSSRGVALGASVLALALGALCWRVSRIWKSDRALWTYAVSVAPDSPRAWAALSRVERLDGNLDAADALAARALSLNPEDIPARVTSIYNFLARGDVDAARRAISYVDLLGGGQHPGMARARSCARLGREEAARCVRSN